MRYPQPPKLLIFSHFFPIYVACMEDLTPQVSQQANLFLGTIHDSSIRTLIQCLEYQFDNIPIDRSVIYQFHEIFQRIFVFFHFTKKKPNF